MRVGGRGGAGAGVFIPKIRMLCFVTINNVLFILVYEFGSGDASVRN